MHPKTEIRPDRESVRHILSAGWVAQLKIHGHRAQIHVSHNLDEPVLVYNRQGQLHKKELPPAIEAEVRRIFAPQQGWNVLDAEWIKDQDRIFVFDFLKQEDLLLRGLSFVERWKRLPRAFISPSLQILPLLRDEEECMAALERAEDWIEGVVFKSSSPGFEDTSIIRCRKAK
jgi:ATP-dependent DNA ligase